MACSINTLTDTELVGRISVHAFDELRGGSFVQDCPNFENDLLNQLLGNLAEENTQKPVKSNAHKKVAANIDTGKGDGSENQHGMPMNLLLTKDQSSSELSDCASTQ